MTYSEIRRVLTRARLARMPSAKREETVRLLREKMKDLHFFQTLPTPDPNHENIRLFANGEHEIIVKDCGEEGTEEHGANPDQLAAFHRAYSRLIKTGTIVPTKYVLYRMKPLGAFTTEQEVPAEPMLGRHGRAYVARKSYVVLEKLRRFKEPGASHRESNEIKSANSALEELQEHIRKVAELTGLRAPQNDAHLFFLGNTNTQEPEKGKWVVALPHDYF